MKSESFRKQALSLVLFFAAVAAVFALTCLRSDPAKKQAEFVVQQLLSCSSAVEQAVDAAASTSGSEPGLAAADTDGLYTFLQAQLGDAMTADCLNKVMANRLPTRITALAGQSGDKLVPADLTLKKRAGAENCYDFSAALLTAADSTAAAQVSGTITMVKEYGDNYKNYVLELPKDHYKVDDWAIKLYPNVNSSYSLFPIQVDIDGLEPEDNYFLPLRIASVSDYMISSERRNVLMQILMKNAYATTKEKSYYTMNGTSLRVVKDTWEPLDKKNDAPDYKPINATKLVAPVTEHGIRILTGSTLTSDRKELRKQGIVVTVHPEEMIDVAIIGSNGLPTGEYIKCQKVTLDKWYDVNGGITVLNIEDTPSYYNPDKKEFTLNYRYNYNSNDWYEMKEVMSPVAIANENN